MTFELINEAFKFFQQVYGLSDSNPHNMRLRRMADRAWQRYKRRVDIWTHQA